MNHKQTIFSFFILAATTFLAAAAPAPVIDIQTIAGKIQADVTKILGKPTQVEKTKYGPKLTYSDGKIEVTFINGKADWITVSNMSGIPFDANAIEALGIKPKLPTFKSAFVIRWEPCANFNSVSVFGLDGKVDYAYIKIATK